jgi:hypothetical protein
MKRGIIISAIVVGIAAVAGGLGIAKKSRHKAGGKQNAGN